LERAKTSLDTTEDFEGKNVIIKALTAPTIANIQQLQKYLYANLEDQSAKNQLAKSSKRGPDSRDG
jgi:hypothetical protein